MAELGDALTKMYELDKRMYQLATQQLGFTDQEWERIKRPQGGVGAGLCGVQGVCRLCCGTGQAAAWVAAGTPGGPPLPARVWTVMREADLVRV